MQGDTEITKMGDLLIQVFKKLGLPCDLAVWVTAVQLKTELQKAEMAVWMWDSKVTDQELILEKARELEQMR